MTGPNETEVKIRIGDAATASQRLRSQGFTESVPRLFESNTIYDTVEGRLKEGGMLLRLRQVGGKAVITWKGPEIPSAHKSRPEIETTVGSHQDFHRILEAVGFRPVFSYQKYRTEFQPQGAAGVVTLDETPIGNFLELEGDGDWIDTAAAGLGFSASDYVLQSYARLYLVDCESRGVAPSHMLFAPDEQIPEADRLNGSL